MRYTDTDANEFRIPLKAGEQSYAAIRILPYQSISVHCGKEPCTVGIGSERREARIDSLRNFTVTVTTVPFNVNSQGKEANVVTVTDYAELWFTLGIDAFRREGVASVVISPVVVPVRLDYEAHYKAGFWDKVTDDLRGCVVLIPVVLGVLFLLMLALAKKAETKSPVEVVTDEKVPDNPGDINLD